MLDDVSATSFQFPAGMFRAARLGLTAHRFITGPDDPAAGEASRELPAFPALLEERLRICLREKQPFMVEGGLPWEMPSLGLLMDLKRGGWWRGANRTAREWLRLAGVEAGPPSLQPGESPEIISLRTLLSRSLPAGGPLSVPARELTWIAYEEPRLALERDGEIRAGWFDLFLDAGGDLADLFLPARHPVPGHWERALAENFPEAGLVPLAGAAAWGGWNCRPEGRPTGNWMMVHAGTATTTVWAMQGRRIRAGWQHATRALSPVKLKDWLVQLARGQDLDDEIQLDGGLFASTRLLPEDPSVWEPILLTGPAAATFRATGVSNWPWIESPYDLELEGLRHWLARRRNPG